MKTTTLTSVFLLIFLSASSGQSWLIKNTAAVDVFAAQDWSSIPNVDNEDAWLKANKAEPLTEGYAPKTNEYYVLYQALFRRYYFRVSNIEHQERAVQALLEMRKRPELSGKRDYIFVFPVKFEAGLPFTFGKGVFSSGVLNNPSRLTAPVEQLLAEMESLSAILDEHPTDSEIEELETKLESLEQMIFGSGLAGDHESEYYQLKEQYAGISKRISQKAEQGAKGSAQHFGDGGRNGDDGGGNSKKSWFPVDVSFSNWMQTLVQCVLKYLLTPQIAEAIEQSAERIAMLAFIIAPELVNNVVSSLARLQHDLVPGGIDAFLNSVAEVLDYAIMIYDSMVALSNLVTDPRFLEMVKNMDIGGLAGVADQFVDSEWLDKFRKSFPGSFSLADMTFEKFQGQLTEFAKDLAESQVKKYAAKLIQNVPVLRDLNIGATYDLISGKINLTEYYKIQAKSILCPRTKKFVSSCDALVDGNYEDAAIKSVSQGLAIASGLSPVAAEELIRAANAKDHRRVWNSLAGMAADKLAPMAGLSPESIKLANNALASGNYREFVRQVANVDTKYFGVYGKRIEKLLAIKNWESLSIDDAKVITNIFLESMVGDNQKLHTMLKSGYDFMYELGAYVDSTNGGGISAYLKAKFKFDDAKVKEYLKGNVQADIIPFADSLMKHMGITSAEAVNEFKQSGFKAAFDSQRQNSGAYQTSWNTIYDSSDELAQAKWQILRSMSQDLMLTLPNDPGRTYRMAVIQPYYIKEVNP